MSDYRQLRSRGSALNDFRALPTPVRKEAGFQLDRLQTGREPNDWKPMSALGIGVKEIRLRDTSGAYRVIYVAKFVDAIYVLHCFQKKSERTSKHDIDFNQAALL